MSPIQYYQVGGFRGRVGRIRQFDLEAKLLAARTLSGDGGAPRRSGLPLDLILGVKDTGTFHLLATESQLCTVLQILPATSYYGPFLVGDFKSLSPIRFANEKELEDKIAFLAPRKFRDRQDTSKANRNAALSNTPGSSMPAFEKTRCFWLMIRGSLDLEQFSLNQSQWNGQVKAVFVFALNRWAPDVRYRNDQPILDIGWAELRLPLSKSGSDTLVGHTHILIEETSEQGLPGRIRAAFKYGNTKKLSMSHCIEYLRSTLREILQRQSSGPVIIIIHDHHKARAFLQDLGINGHGDESGIDGLVVYNMSSGIGNLEDRKQNPTQGVRKRSRSCSPMYQGPSRQNQTSAAEASSSRDLPLSTIYTIDICALYSTLRQSVNLSTDLPDMCETLGILAPAKEWNAGNDVELMYQVLAAMVAGPPAHEHTAKTEELEQNCGIDATGTHMLETVLPLGDIQDPNLFNGRTHQKREFIADADADAEDDYDSDL